MILQHAEARRDRQQRGACGDCGAPAGGNFCSSCGADLRASSLGFLGQAAAPMRRSFPAVYLKLLRAPIRQTVALAEDPSYRGYLSFALTGIALYCLLFVPVVMRMLVPTGGAQVSESMQTLMKVLSQAGIYVGMAITFLLAYGLFRLFARAAHVRAPTSSSTPSRSASWRRSTAPTSSSCGLLGGIGMSSLGACMTEADWTKPTTLMSSRWPALWAYFVAIHRRFWAMPIWKATGLYVVASLVSGQVGYWLMWWVGFYSAMVLRHAGIVTTTCWRSRVSGGSDGARSTSTCHLPLRPARRPCSARSPRTRRAGWCGSPSLHRGREVLAVVEHEPPLGEMVVEGGKADLGGVALAAELGFGVEHAPDGDAVAAADQSPVDAPHLEGVRQAEVVQSRIEPHDLRRDPGEAERAPLARFGAGLDHLIEGIIEGDVIRSCASAAAHRLEMRNSAGATPCARCASTT